MWYDGIMVNETDRKKTSLSIRPEVWLSLRLAAMKAGMTVGEYVEWLMKRKEEPPR